MLRTVAALCALAAAPALAESHAMPAMAPAATVGAVEIGSPVIRATPPGAPVAGGFLTVRNTGEADDVLLGASAAGEVAGRTELHRMTMTDGVMAMSEVEGGIPVPAGETVVLMPGGLHLMLMDLAAPLEAGTSQDLTLTFELAGEVSVPFRVLEIGEVRAAFEGMEGGMRMDHGDTGHGGMEHGAEGGEGN